MYEITPEKERIMKAMYDACNASYYKEHGKHAIDKLAMKHVINRSLIEDVFISAYGGFKHEIERRDRKGNMTRRIIKKYILPIREQFEWFYQYRHHKPEKSERDTANITFTEQICNMFEDNHLFHPTDEAIKDYYKLKLFFNIAIKRADLSYDEPIDDRYILAGVKLLLKEDYTVRRQGFECYCGTLDIYPNARGYVCYECGGALIRSVDRDAKTYMGAFNLPGSSDGCIQSLAKERKEKAFSLNGFLGALIS